ncbi:septation protein A [Legionella israelensis]|uniref:Inner membrane-spanning protein YciB n=1 Tax=Legionella israelensis TaxID=454 RepID=A0A0W0VH52_9GAMM|nr:septation protein A [Legionella israelensis]KTD19493.1 intracellular septation protein A [Legionella israelensis]QBS08661.1 septation protein A [Legionella israelensis]SCY46092.1 intracellular septation protein [Legionella israelensis DSM 19235]STX58325.1 intracellular septation protein [Legionella israelensis]
MKFLFDFFPIVLFFLGFKWFGIYYATAIAMSASLLQVVIYRLKYQCYDKFQLISFLIILVLGGATLFLQNPWFIKWKPTGIYWLTALIFFLTTFIGKKPVIQRMMENNISMPNKIWKRINLAWALFFLLMGIANLYVAYFYDTNVWVNFKLFGGIGFTLIFVFIQAIYLTKHIDDKSLEKRQASQERN